MKIEIFDDATNSKIRGNRINGDKLKEEMTRIVQDLKVSYIAQGGNDPKEKDAMLLLMALQMVWNEKEELAEELKTIKDVLPEVGMNDHKTIGGGDLDE